MACIPVLQNVRTSLDQKMMHNVNTAVQQADALLVIVDATSNLAEVLEMPGMAPGWSGPPAALVSPVRSRRCGWDRCCTTDHRTAADCDTRGAFMCSDNWCSLSAYVCLQGCSRPVRYIGAWDYRAGTYGWQLMVWFPAHGAGAEQGGPPDISTATASHRVATGQHRRSSRPANISTQQQRGRRRAAVGCQALAAWTHAVP